jgi:hypothetical protein
LRQKDLIVYYITNPAYRAFNELNVLRKQINSFQAETASGVPEVELPGDWLEEAGS